MLKKILLYVLMLSLSFSCSLKEEADMIIINANIYTIDNSFSKAEAMAVKDGKIVETGLSGEIVKKYDTDQLIDLSGFNIYPGFIDAHCHFLGYGKNLLSADLSATNSFEEILEIMKDHAGKSSGLWLTGRGWDQNRWADKQFPEKTSLDLLFPDRPVLLTRIDGHAALANSKALNMGKIYKNSKVNGGEFVKNEKGELTGILIDNAIQYVSKFIPSITQQEIESVLLAAQADCFAAGLTSVHDAGLDKRIIEIIQKLNNEDKLKMRIYAMLQPSTSNLENYLYKGIHKTEYLHIRSLKLFADGALGSRGARLIEPYSDDKQNYGLFTTNETVLREICETAYKFGYQVNTHCIGDAANRLMLHIYGDILKEKNDKRWRIEHSQVIHPDDFIFFSKYSIIPSIQTTHATSDMHWAENRLGPERVKYAYAYKKLLDTNGWLPNGSDFPVESINPLYGFYAAISRKDHKGYPAEGFQKENALTREEALKAMTIWAAKAAFEEVEKGSLEPGKLADFVVLDNDIMEISENKIIDTKVMMTVVGGKIVYFADDSRISLTSLGI